MSLFNELPIVFPWYEKIEQQNRHIETVEQDCDFKLITPKDALLPFEFRKPIESMPVKWVIIEASYGAIMYNLSIAGIIRRVTRAGKDYIYYNGQKIKDLALADITIAYGFYYSRLEFADGSFYYSEMFHVPDQSFSVSDVSIDYLKLEWWNDNDLAPIFYDDKVAGKPYFTNVVYLDAFINSSDPEIIEDGTKDGSDEVIVTFSKAIINHRISEFVPDYLKRAIVICQMHDHIFLTTKRNIRSGEVEKMEVTTSIEDDAAFSNIEILIQDEIAIVKKGCGENMV